MQRLRFSSFIFIGVTLFVILFHYRDSWILRRAPATGGEGLISYDRLRAYDGFNQVDNFRDSGPPSCLILTMEGRVVLTFPGNVCLFTENGGYYSFLHDNWLAHWDSNLKLLWTQKVNAHHDLSYDAETGVLYVWTYEHDHHVDGHFPTNVDVLLGIDQQGKTVFRWSALEHRAELEKVFGKKLTFHFSEIEERKHWDFTHFNSIEVLPESRWSEKIPAFVKGNFLVSGTHDSRPMILDAKTGQVTWLGPKGGRDIHFARFLRNGNILYFQNLVSEASMLAGNYYSRVSEFIPSTQHEVWFYQSPENMTFYAEIFGAVQRLPNGNTLISNKAGSTGAFEVTPSGRVVWEWRNPKSKDGFSGQVYRVQRISPTTVERLLQAVHSLDDLSRRAYSAQ